MSKKKEGVRYLISHPESNSLFEVFGEEARIANLVDGDGHCQDVTGVFYWENLFKIRKQEKGQDKGKCL